MFQRLLLLLVVLAVSTDVAFSYGDPSHGWLSYAKYKTPKSTDIITRLKATMVTPNNPASPGGRPAFWFGLQTAEGNGALVQPILAKWRRAKKGWFMFQEVFDWSMFKKEDDNPYFRHKWRGLYNKQTHHIQIFPGDIVTAEVWYVKSTNSYKMTMSSSGTTEKSNYVYQLPHAETLSQAYFVLEHQPANCNEYPDPGKISFTDIEMDINGQPIEDPLKLFVAEDKKPACGSKAIVEDDRVTITWTGKDTNWAGRRRRRVRTVSSRRRSLSRNHAFLKERCKNKFCEEHLKKLGKEIAAIKSLPEDEKHIEKRRLVNVFKDTWRL